MLLSGICGWPLFDLIDLGDLAVEGDSWCTVFGDCETFVTDGDSDVLNFLDFGARVGDGDCG